MPVTEAKCNLLRAEVEKSALNLRGREAESVM
jgi:hypothetical protein